MAFGHYNGIISGYYWTNSRVTPPETRLFEGSGHMNVSITTLFLNVRMKPKLNKCHHLTSLNKNALI